MRHDKEDKETKNQATTPQYKIMSEIPHNWIPYVPVSIDDKKRSIQLQRASMPRMTRSEEKIEIIQPRTHILNLAGQNHTIKEEAITRTGLRIKINYQRGRWIDGSVHTWLGRSIVAGRGQGSSGLKFDYVVENEDEMKNE